MGEFSAEGRAKLLQKLELPEDASNDEILAAADYLVAKAEAKKNGTVGKDRIRAAIGVSDDEPERIVAAAFDTMMLQQAKVLGLPASTPRKDLRLAIGVAKRVQASAAAETQRQIAAAQAKAAEVQAAVAAPARVAAATAADLTGTYALNPLVAQAQVDRVYASSVEASGGSVPTLFRSGDLPAFTASGVEPKLLAKIPWEARHAIAAEPDRGRVLNLFEQLSGPDSEMVVSELSGHDGNREYTHRVNAWQQAGWDLDRQRAEQKHAEAEAARQEEVRAALGDPDDWTDEQIHEHFFGDIDRRKEAKKLEQEKAIVEGRAWGHGFDVEKVRASMEARIAASGGRQPKTTSRSIDWSKIIEEGE